MYVGYMTTPIAELWKGLDVLFPLDNYSDGRTDDLWSTEKGKSYDGKRIARVTAIYYLPMDKDGVLPADKSKAVLIWSEEGSMAD
jgi:hypothetical protein